MKDNQNEIEHSPEAAPITSSSTEGSGNLRGVFPNSSSLAPPCSCDACRNDGRRIWLKDDADGEYKPVQHTDYPKAIDSRYFIVDKIVAALEAVIAELRRKN